MTGKNNLISVTQWNELIRSIVKNRIDTEQPNDVLYEGCRSFGNSKRFYCYDNYDRMTSPGFDLVISNDDEFGKLTVYCGSEQARAPISFAEGEQIAKSFFDYLGYELAESIVCEWVMAGNVSTF